MKNGENNGVLAGVPFLSPSRSPNALVRRNSPFPFPFPFKRLPRRLNCLRNDIWQKMIAVNVSRVISALNDR